MGATPVDVRIQHVFTHPGFSTGALKNDFAILRLSQPVTFTSTIGPVCLPDASATAVLNSIPDPKIIGWGSTIWVVTLRAPF